jgi:membrane-bound lytic murein transglycosylase B
MQGIKLFRLTLAVALLMLALACASTTASAATGGTTAPSGTSGSGSSGSSSSGGTAPRSGSKSPSTGTSPSPTGGISPSAVRPPTAPVKPKPKKHKKPKKRKRRRHPAQPPAPATPPTPPTTTPAPAPSTPPGPGVADIPARYLAIYKAAGAKYGVDWRVLAAIGKNESDHGRSTAPGVASGRNYANCCSGPMQICTVQSCSNTWGYYGIDANGDGVVSVYDPEDAINGAAALVRDLKAIVGTDPKLLLAAYNAGPGNVKKYKGVPPFPETQAYVKAGVAYINSLR